MTSALEGGEGGSRKVDKSTDKLRDHIIIVGPDLPSFPSVELLVQEDALPEIALLSKLDSRL